MTKAFAEARPKEAAPSQVAVAGQDAVGVEDITCLPPGQAAWFTVVVPTRNEQDGVGVLLERLAESLVDVRAEVLFVDDSNDGTPEAIRESARPAGLPVRLLHRPAGSRRGGLAGAVVAGLKAA